MISRNSIVGQTTVTTFDTNTPEFSNMFVVGAVKCSTLHPKPRFVTNLFIFLALQLKTCSDCEFAVGQTIAAKT